MTRAPTFFAVPAGTKPAECRGCRAPVFWIETGSGKKMPVDCDVDGGAEPTADDGGLGISHFGTCAKAAEFRRPR